MYLQIKKASAALFLSLVCVSAFAQKKISGTVLDANGDPVIGATVNVDGVNGAITDLDGNFTLNNAKPSSTITVSYIGFKSKKLKIGESSVLNVQLEEDNANLDEVVVVGYGTMKKSDLTGSISSTDGEKLAAKGTTNAMEALQGSVPGASITQTSGRAGSDFNIQIRGASSISSETTPLYVVDGIICDNIDFLNPQDIERMDILKDASSTAIYGSRATAGVVIVTTKSGTSVKVMEKATISYDGYYGVSKVARMPEYMNAQQFYNYRFSEFLSSGQFTNGISSVAQPIYQMKSANFEQGTIFDDNGNSVMKQMIANGESYDWPSLVTQNGQKQNHYIAVNGSSKTIHYHFGVGYNRDEGVYKGDLQNRYNLKGSVDGQVNKFLNVGFSLNASYTKNDYASDDAVKIAFRQVPFARPYNSDGQLNEKPANYEALGSNSKYQFSDAYNSLVMLQDDSKQKKTFRLLGNLYFQVKPTKWLSFKSTFSPNFINSRTGLYTAGSCDRTETASHEEYTKKEWTWDNQFDFNKSFGDHSLNAMFLYSLNSQDYTYSQIGRSTTETGALMTGTQWFNLYAGTINEEGTGTSYYQEKLQSYAMRLNYTYAGKYMFTGTLRTDGSSKFLEGHRWGWFPSAAIAWRMSEEKFIKDIKWIDNLKLRLSYGVTGNNKFKRHYNAISVDGPSIYSYGSTVANGYYPSGIINAALMWEKSHEVNFGVDYSFIGGRINGSIDIYNKLSSNLLYDRELPLVTGGGSLIDNVGKVRNHGIEFALNTVNIQNKDWNWTTSFNFAKNNNEVKIINGENRIISASDPITKSLFVGESVNNIYAFKWTGIVSDQNMTVPNNQAAINNGFTPGETVKSADYYYKVYKWNEGMPIIEDVNGDGSITDDDWTVLGSRDPSWTGNISSTLTWKNIDFSFSIYTKQNFWNYSYTLADTYDYNYRGWNKINMDYYIPAGTLINCDGVNADGTYINPVYQEATHYGTFPFPNASASGYGVGTYLYNKGVYNMLAIDKISYWKVKNITLGYTFPKNMLTSWGCESLRLYVNITNPFVFTKYKGFDPEWADASQANDGPSTVTYQIGASIKF